MTTAALWMPPARPAPVVVRPDLQGDRWKQALADPRVLTVLIVVALIFIVGFRHSIARTIGTAAPAPVVQTTSVRSLLRAPPGLALPRSVAPRVAVPLHAPRDPFAPISSEPMSAPLTTTTLTRVRAGDSLWSIARHQLKTSASAEAVATAWHRIYAANRSVVGQNPSALRVGVVLDLQHN